MAELEKYKKHRKHLVDSMSRELFGPDQNSPEDQQNEELEISPLLIYGAGILFPKKQPHERLEGHAEEADAEPENLLDDENSENDLDQVPEINDGGNVTSTSVATDAGIEEQPLNLANEFSPSALGITFKVQGTPQLETKISFARYDTVQKKEAHPKAGEQKLDGTPYPDHLTKTIYQRIPRLETIKVSTDFNDSPNLKIPIPGTEDLLKLHATLRSKQNHEPVISLMLVNHNELAGTTETAVKDTYFQIEFEVADSDGKAIFVPIEIPIGNSVPSEIASLDLLYRHRKTFSLGHGCAGDWHRSNEVDQSQRTNRVSTATIPCYEVQPIEAREKPFSVKALDLSMYVLSGGDKETDERKTDIKIINSLEQLCLDYELWIKEQTGVAENLDAGHSETADKHLGLCRECLNRMREGVRLLASDDPKPLMAFKLANRAMLMQQIHTNLDTRNYGSEYPVIPDDYTDFKRKWRPFQLAFILMNINGACDPEHDDRLKVDLIWFPTGGGKTEAYLGLTAFTIALRRITNPEDNGTAVLMRYTLRLLTAQQFQRASGLTLALEHLRQKQYLNIDLGKKPISIGLWVGQSLSPNSRAAAKSALRKLQKDKYSPNPFQVLNCPWCGCALSDSENLGYREEKLGQSTQKTVVFRCPDSNCSWSAGHPAMPILVIDDDIYENPPTLLMGTVDKFAQISWKTETRQFFGIGSDSKAPELIIQDELHLISGPLGSIVGMYEGAIERFCQKGDETPKIVASTATIRQAQDQCKALFNRNMHEFPPRGLRAGDTYFAYENREAPGRLYAGVFATGLKSHATAQVRTCSALLQHNIPSPNSTSLKGEDKDPVIEKGHYFEEADPYGTLVWYFNSLRELGYATTMCTADIQEYLKNLAYRRGIPYDFRRRIRSYVELTSRRTADEIPEILRHLGQEWLPNPGTGTKQYPVDILLATNMISVGVDVSRLGLMVVTGQPKSSSEYIQATSRVGRGYPGLVVTIYNQGKSRDRSHYEQFIGYHQSYYRFVEATSITPFSPPARERGLKGVLIALARLGSGLDDPSRISHVQTRLREEIDLFLERVADIDQEEEEDTAKELEEALADWIATAPPEYGKMAGKPQVNTLAYPFGSTPDPNFQNASWPVLTSMRNVDGTASARVITSYKYDTVDDNDNGGNT